jgi:hypothetical protein
VQRIQVLPALKLVIWYQLVALVEPLTYFGK